MPLALPHSGPSTRDSSLLVRRIPLQWNCDRQNVGHGNDGACGEKSTLDKLKEWLLVARVSKSPFFTQNVGVEDIEYLLQNTYVWEFCGEKGGKTVAIEEMCFGLGCGVTGTSGAHIGTAVAELVR